MTRRTSAMWKTASSLPAGNPKARSSNGTAARKIISGTPTTSWDNHDHNGNGLGDDQFTPYENSYGWSLADFYTSCPYDSDDDGAGDQGGCFSACRPA